MVCTAGLAEVVLFGNVPCQNFSVSLLPSANAQQKIRGISFVESLIVPHEYVFLEACLYHGRYSICSHLISYVNEILEHFSLGLEAPTFKQESKMGIA